MAEPTEPWAIIAAEHLPHRQHVREYVPLSYQCCEAEPRVVLTPSEGREGREACDRCGAVYRVRRTWQQWGTHLEVAVRRGPKRERREGEGEAG
jgi:hypothetical protein